MPRRAATGASGRAAGAVGELPWQGEAARLPPRLLPPCPAVEGVPPSAPGPLRPRGKPPVDPGGPERPRWESPGEWRRAAGLCQAPLCA